MNKRRRYHVTFGLHDKRCLVHVVGVDLDPLFRALSDPTRRRLLDELGERDGQTLFELHVRLISWHGAALSRQALSKHLGVLGEAGLVRTEWRWRSKHHFLEREPLRRLWRVWLGPLAERSLEGGETVENRSDERAGR
jgi:DNA-binding transcriptional ArsR family regulator